MSDTQGSTEPLIGTPSQQTAIYVGPQERSGSSTRAYKVAGLTLLACVLIAGQALIAYYVFSQKSDIQSLQDQNNDLKDQMMRGSGGAAPMQVHMPMNIMPRLTSDFNEEEASTGTPEKTAGSGKATQCQLEAAGVRPVRLPSFRPLCDEQGHYRAQQCWNGHCWCVDPASGEELSDTIHRGRSICSGADMPAVGTGRMSQAMAPPSFRDFMEE